MSDLKRFLSPTAFVLLALTLLVTPKLLHADSFDSFCNNGINDSTPSGTHNSPGEACEDYNSNDHDDCLSDCHLAACGDGILHTTNSDTDPTNSIPDLQIFKGQVDALESCDDGNTNGGDGCSNTCAVEALCGNGVLDPGEVCDASVNGADPNNSTKCNTGCNLIADCQNGTVDPGEQCDDGNNTAGDGCEPDCTFTPLGACGDGNHDFQEQCDDGNNTNGDGCSANCIVEGCGNGFVETGEQCDDGRQCTDGTDCTNNPDACSALVDKTCAPRDGDGCSATCQSESLCGNGKLDNGEQCDDGNQNDRDLCKNNCTLNTAAAAAGAVCGDGILTPPESCDDGNTVDGDGCSNSCVLENGVTTCGNCIPEAGECTDAAIGFTGSCDSDCQPGCVPAGSTTGGTTGGTTTGGTTSGTTGGTTGQTSKGGGCSLIQVASSESAMGAGLIFVALGLLSALRKRRG